MNNKKTYIFFSSDYRINLLNIVFRKLWYPKWRSINKSFILHSSMYRSDSSKKYKFHQKIKNYDTIFLLSSGGILVEFPVNDHNLVHKCSDPLFIKLNKVDLFLLQIIMLSARIQISLISNIHFLREDINHSLSYKPSFSNTPLLQLKTSALSMFFNYFALVHLTT